MTIRKGIDPGAVLWKTKEKHHSHRWVPNPAGGHMQERHEYERYYAIVLETRRARTQGYQIKPELRPFFEQIRIRLNRVRVYNGNHRDNDTFEYIAVGTRRRRISEEEYNSLPINEVAARWYTRVTNDHMTPFLDKYEEPFSTQVIEDMRQQAQDDDSPVVEWPEEPVIHPRNEQLNRHQGFSVW